jgi:hypothetical protein
MFGKENKEVKVLIQDAVMAGIKNAIADTKSALGKLNQIAKLNEEIEGLKIEKNSREWEYKKKEEEIEHKVGLERKRQEFEVEQAKREATVALREENLAAEKKQFETNMKFIQDRFEKEVGYLKDILSQVLKCVQEVKKNGGS